jgi:hypothetical protein
MLLCVLTGDNRLLTDSAIPQVAGKSPRRARFVLFLGSQHICTAVIGRARGASGRRYVGF